ncbi:MAG: cytochrome c biogenesis protein CcdA [Firmicutes bacterium]|nr:cytochrome c biogenesis protein CcdA [Bacillota bacterium]
MQYLITFIEGVITFISPCLLPMLPIYISYFAGGEHHSVVRALKNSVGFCCGFTLVFLLMGALAGTLGSFLQQYRTVTDLITGGIVVLFGLHFLGVFRLSIFRGIKGDVLREDMGFFSSMLFGIVFSVGWTPCVGAFLGSALMLASREGQMFVGMTLLFCYSLGLALPFILSAVLIDQLKSSFQWIKSHYRQINIVCGCFLVLVGILMMTGMLGKYLTLLS